MPTTGKECNAGTSENNYNGYSSLFSHKQEKAFQVIIVLNY